MNLKDKIETYFPANIQEEKDKEIMLQYLRLFDNSLTRENEMGHFTASSWIINKDRSKVLMIYHNIFKSWSWVGGHADGNVDLLAVALRETTEETGLEKIEPLSEDIFSLEVLCVNGHMKNNNYVASHVHLNLTYLLLADEKEPLRVKPDENSGIKWMTFREAITNCSEPCMLEIYQKLNAKLNAFN